MAATLTLDAIKKQLEDNKYCLLTFDLIFYLLNTTLTDDVTFDAQIASLVASKTWVDTYEIDWIKRTVLFRVTGSPV